MSELSDQLLLSMYLRGDRGAFDAIYRRYAPRIHAIAFRLTNSWEDAEDALQETFLRLARQAGAIKERGALRVWLYRVAVNCSTDLLRRRRRTVSVDEDPESGARILAVEGLRREREQERRRRRESMLRQVESLIPRLPERQSAVFVLRGFQGMSHREIASVLGCSESASKSHYSLACGKLREWVARADEETHEHEEAGGAPS